MAAIENFGYKSVVYLLYLCYFTMGDGGVLVSTFVQSLQGFAEMKTPLASLYFLIYKYEPFFGSSGSKQETEVINNTIANITTSGPSCARRVKAEPSGTRNNQGYDPYQGQQRLASAASTGLTGQSSAPNITSSRNSPMSSINCPSKVQAAIIYLDALNPTKCRMSEKDRICLNRPIHPPNAHLAKPSKGLRRCQLQDALIHANYLLR